MKRRVALKQILMATAVAAILPACVFDKKKKEASVNLNHFPPITGEQEETMAAVCETLIPETDIPGAKSIAAHLFVFKMVDDCYGPEVQDKFMDGLIEMDNLSDKRFGEPFAACTPKQREEILLDIDAKEGTHSAGIREFFKLTKRHAIQGFMTCEYVMTKIQGYEFVPGRFNGCFEISKLKKS